MKKRKKRQNQNSKQKNFTKQNKSRNNKFSRKKELTLYLLSVPLISFASIQTYSWWLESSEQKNKEMRKAASLLPKPILEHIEHVGSLDEVREVQKIDSRTEAAAFVFQEITPEVTASVINDFVEDIAKKLRNKIPNYENYTLQTRLKSMMDFITSDIGISYQRDKKEAKNARHSLLTNIPTSKRGECISLTSFVIILAKELGMDLSMVTTPRHVFARYDDGIRKINVECVASKEGQTVVGHPDDFYIQRYKIPQAAIDSGVYMKSLKDQEILAKLFNERSNYYRALMRIGKKYKIQSENHLRMVRDLANSLYLDPKDTYAATLLAEDLINCLIDRWHYSYDSKKALKIAEELVDHIERLGDDVRVVRARLDQIKVNGPRHLGDENFLTRNDRSLRSPRIAKTNGPLQGSTAFPIKPDRYKGFKMPTHLKRMPHHFDPSKTLLNNNVNNMLRRMYPTAHFPQ